MDQRVYQRPDNEKEAKFCLNTSRRVGDKNFRGRNAPLATARRLGEALVGGSCYSVVVMKEGIPLQALAHRLMESVSLKDATRGRTV